jgi:Fe2+ transport system protein B
VYAWIWRHLPGPVAVKTACALVLTAAVVWLLFSFVFPWLEPLSPFGGSGAVDPGSE